MVGLILREVIDMKNKAMIFMILGLVLAIIAGVIIMQFHSKKQTDVGTFELTKYQWEIENFPSDKNVGQVNDSDTAIEKAKELWIEEFSVIDGKPYNPINGRKIEVSYDSDEECWHINGTLKPDTLGGVPHAIIRKNGNVIAVWHDD